MIIIICTHIPQCIAACASQFEFASLSLSFLTAAAASSRSIAAIVMTQSTDVFDSVEPQWQVSTHAADASVTDPFASSSSVDTIAELITPATVAAAVLNPIDDVDFAVVRPSFTATPAASVSSSQHTHTAAALEAKAGTATPTPPAALPLSSLLPDSADYIARLERRLAKLHAAPLKRALPPRRHAGEEFTVAASNPNANWIDLPATTADDSAVAEAHSSDDDESDSTRADGRGIPQPLARDEMESVALLATHMQVVDVNVTAVAATDTTATATNMIAASTGADEQRAPLPAPAADSTLIEPSDGSETSAPVHQSVAAAHSGEAAAAQPMRRLYYQSQACMAQMIGWWEERD